MRPDAPASSNDPAGRGATHPYLAGPYPRALVHRGWHLGELAQLENSLTSFRRALDEGFRYLEIDVHATRDGVVVVSHDATLDRTTDGTGPIAEQAWERVRRARVGGREPVAALREVLDELPDALLNIDVKAARAVEPTLALLDDADAWGRVALASFSDSRLTALRRAGGDRLITSCSPPDVLRLWARGRLGRARLGWVGGWLPVPCRLAQVPRRRGRLGVVDAGFLAAAHRLGMEVHVWTVNDPGEMRELLDLGVDGLVTDRPDLLRGVLTDRGQWWQGGPDRASGSGGR